MTLRRLVILSSILFLAFSAHSQQAPTTATKDSQAVSILTQSLNTVGGVSAVSAIQDYTGNGNITYNWAGEQVEASVTVRGMGVSTFRVDSTLSNGTRTWAVDGSTGTLILPDGTRQGSALYNLTTAGSLTLPAVRLASILSNISTSITYVGQVTANGHTSYQIHCVLPGNSSLPATTIAPGYGSFDLFIDSTSFLLVELTETVYSEANLQIALSHEIDFSNYQLIGGVACPYGISESINGQQTWSITLSSLSFNAGLTETTFTP
jgi:outer membrane lipoprotein-sorting protein